ncbi:MAG: chaperonin GroEL [Eubacteriales bacterium]|nr:chaperonin GroEL [Eubacteriales bacterium]
MNNILYGQDIREKVLSGITVAADAVKVTLGPGGRSAIIMEAPGRPLVVKKGSVVLQAVKTEDIYEDMGIRLIREAASKMEELVGDGTAVSVTLADFILRECIKNIVAGADVIELKKGIQGAVQLSCAAIRKLAVPVRNENDIRCVAAVAAGSASAGEMVAEAMAKVGPEGTISVEETADLETTLEIAEGMQYEKGYLSVEMLTDPGSLQEELEHPFILVTDAVISGAEELVPLLEQLRAAGRPLLIISENIAAEVRSFLILNKKRGIVNTVAAYPPAYGDGRLQRMEDICVFTGGTFITERLGYRLRDVKIDMLGKAEKVVISKNKTVMINGSGNASDIRKHLAGLRHSIETESYDFKRERLQERLAKFTGRTARIRVGAPTETEMKEEKYRLESAVKAAKAALEKGIVPGGGTVYLKILPAIRAYVDRLEGDRKTGASIIAKTLEVPLRQIAGNNGQDPVAAADTVKGLPGGFGYDAVKDEYVDMMSAGILDPAISSELALKCAASAAVSLMTTEAAVIKTE